MSAGHSEAAGDGYPPEAGHTGNVAMHRALRSLEFPKRRLLDVIAIPCVLNVCCSVGWTAINRLWQAIIQLWAAGFPETLSMHVEKAVFPLIGVVTSARVEAALPSDVEWLAGLLVSVILLFAPRLLPRRMLPVTYAMRLVGLIQLTAQCYFYVWPVSFRHDADSMIASQTQSATVIIFLTPWVFGLLYNIFDFGIARKLLLSFMATAYLIVVTPLQYCLIALILGEFSLLWYPVLALLGSTFVQLSSLVGFYSWAMSWRQNRGKPHAWRV